MTVASTPTLLSLDRFARMFGISPVHFSGAGGTDIFPLKGGCSDVWFQKSYIGSDRVSRDDLAAAIDGAEEDVARFLGYWPAPKWITREVHMFPRHQRPDVFDYGVNQRGDAKSLKLKYGRFIEGGVRVADLIGQVDDGLGGGMVWSDPDGDGFDELVTLTVATGLASSTIQEMKVYFYGGADCEWEVRPLKSCNIVAGNLIIELDFWQVIDPLLQDPYPTGSATALNITAAIYVDNLWIYHVYTDNTQPAVTFYWEPRERNLPCPSCGGTGCVACQMTTQDGCLHPRDVMLGIVVPSPATYDRGLASWQGSTYTLCYAPDLAKVSYFAGERSEGWLAGKDLDPFPRWLAETVGWIAIARLERNFCNCGNLTALQNELRSEMSRTDSGGPTWFLSDTDGMNPFGTKVGEVRAWRRLRRLADRIAHVAVI